MEQIDDNGETVSFFVSALSRNHCRGGCARRSHGGVGSRHGIRSCVVHSARCKPCCTPWTISAWPALAPADIRIPGALRHDVRSGPHARPCSAVQCAQTATHGRSRTPRPRARTRTRTACWLALLAGAAAVRTVTLRAAARTPIRSRARACAMLMSWPLAGQRVPHACGARCGACARRR